MTGFGRGEASNEGLAVVVETRSLNSRYLEIAGNLPKRLAHRELDLREIVKNKISRGKLSITISIEDSRTSTTTVKLNTKALQEYYDALMEVRKQLKVKETIKLEHLLQIPDIFAAGEAGDNSDEEWELISQALGVSLDKLNDMRRKEGRELARDLHNRVKHIEKNMEKIEQLAIERVPQERQRLRERIAKLFESDEIDEQRLEMEIVMMADKLDISEEIVRMRSHIKFYIEALKGNDQAGRTVNFLLQEMHREINTIGSKGNDAAISHIVVAVKEDLERIREQVQNIE
jgi:uncharacterized protein (TIGR00255 family)